MEVSRFSITLFCKHLSMLFPQRMNNAIHLSKIFFKKAISRFMGFHFFSFALLRAYCWQVLQ